METLNSSTLTRGKTLLSVVSCLRSDPCRGYIGVGHSGVTVKGKGGFLMSPCRDRSGFLRPLGGHEVGCPS